MPNPNPRTWSDLSSDLLELIFERLSFADFHRAKIVCSSWNSSSKRTIRRKIEPPWLILFPDGGDDFCVLYNPNEDRIYKTKRDFSDSRFLASCGKWFLMLDSRSRLYIIHVFKGDRIDLPPLESSFLKRVECRDKEFEWEVDDEHVFLVYADEIRGRLWVDEKTNEFSVAWFFDARPCFVRFYKKGNDHYHFVSVRFDIPKMLNGLHGLVLRGYRLYMLTTRRLVRVIDFSGRQGFQELTGTDPSPTFIPLRYDCCFSIAVKTSGEVLLVINTTSETSERTFRVYKKDPSAEPAYYMPDLLEVDSLVVDKAVLLDLGIVVPANHTLGIKPNSIYFTRHDLIRSRGQPGKPCPAPL